MRIVLVGVVDNFIVFMKYAISAELDFWLIWMIGRKKKKWRSEMDRETVEGVV